MQPLTSGTFKVGEPQLPISGDYDFGSFALAENCFWFKHSINEKYLPFFLPSVNSSISRESAEAIVHGRMRPAAIQMSTPIFSSSSLRPQLQSRLQTHNRYYLLAAHIKIII